jgi:phosphoglycolate phosphatase-like HAD superfamily hydrolase
MVAAAAAAMIPIGVTTGSVVSREALEGAGAATVVDTLDEIADALTPPAGA